MIEDHFLNSQIHHVKTKHIEMHEQFCEKEHSIYVNTKCFNHKIIQIKNCLLMSEILCAINHSNLHCVSTPSLQIHVQRASTHQHTHQHTHHQGWMVSDPGKQFSTGFQFPWLTMVVNSVAIFTTYLLTSPFQVFEFWRTTLVSEQETLEPT